MRWISSTPVKTNTRISLRGDAILVRVLPHPGPGDRAGMEEVMEYDNGVVRRPALFPVYRHGNIDHAQ